MCDSGSWEEGLRGAGWGPEHCMNVLSRWRKGLSANAEVALPPAGSAPLPVPGVERAPRRWRRLTPRRVALGGIKAVLKLSATMVIVVLEIGRASGRERGR